MERKIDLLAKSFMDRIDFLFPEMIVVLPFAISSSMIHDKIQRALIDLTSRKMSDIDIFYVRSVMEDDFDLLPFVIDDNIAKCIMPLFLKCGMQSLMNGDIFSESFERFISSLANGSKINDTYYFDDFAKDLNFHETACIVDYIAIAKTPDFRTIDPSSFSGIGSVCCMEFWTNQLKARLIDHIERI